MDNVSEPPFEGSNLIKEALKTVAEIYKKAGLSDNAIKQAIHELEPYLEQFAEPSKSEMALPSNLGLSPEQIAGVVKAHTECVQDIFSRHAKALGMSLCTIAGIIGSKYCGS